MERLINVGVARVWHGLANLLGDVVAELLVVARQQRRLRSGCGCRRRVGGCGCRRRVGPVVRRRRRAAQAGQRLLDTLLCGGGLGGRRAVVRRRRAVRAVITAGSHGRLPSVRSIVPVAEQPAIAWLRRGKPTGTTTRITTAQSCAAGGRAVLRAVRTRAAVITALLLLLLLLPTGVAVGAARRRAPGRRAVGRRWRHVVVVRVLPRVAQRAHRVGHRGTGCLAPASSSAPFPLLTPSRKVSITISFNFAKINQAPWYIKNKE